MAIQIRRGQAQDFDSSKLLPGEWAVSLDNKKIYIAFAPGDTKQMATYEDMVVDIQNATQEIIDNLTVEVNQATQDAEAATVNANQATDDAIEATTLTNEATDRANQAAENAESIVLGDIATETTVGVVRSGGEVKVDPLTGDMSVPTKLDKIGDSKDNTVSFTQASADSELTTRSTHATLFGLIKKKFADIVTTLSGKVNKTDIVNSDTINDANKVASSAITYALGQEIDAVNTKFNANGYVADLNTTNKIHSSYNENTLNTPYKQGLTGATIGVCLTINFSANNSDRNTQVQIAFAFGASLAFTRSGTGAWTAL